jgi:hypothetical protein
MASFMISISFRIFLLVHLLSVSLLAIDLGSLYIVVEIVSKRSSLYPVVP